MHDRRNPVSVKVISKTIKNESDECLKLFSKVTNRIGY